MKENKMKNLMAYKIGLWLDHSEAKLIEAETGKIKIIHSPVEGRVRIDGEDASGTRLGNFRSTNNEVHKHNREQNEIHSFYKFLAKEILPYDEFYIFGPTTARNEFHNYLLKEKEFSGKIITVAHGDYDTDNQLAVKVRNFFSKEIKS